MWDNGGEAGERPAFRVASHDTPPPHSNATTHPAERDPAMDWFAVDKDGLARLMERKGKPTVVLELAQNSWDEDGTTEVDIRLAPHETRGYSRLVVTDNAPDGFADLTHAFTLFAPSRKVTDATKA